MQSTSFSQTLAKSCARSHSADMCGEEHRTPSCEHSLSLCDSCVLLQLTLQRREGRNPVQLGEANLRVIRRVRNKICMSRWCVLQWLPSPPLPSPFLTAVVFLAVGWAGSRSPVPWSRFTCAAPGALCSGCTRPERCECSWSPTWPAPGTARSASNPPATSREATSTWSEAGSCTWCWARHRGLGPATCPASVPAARREWLCSCRPARRGTSAAAPPASSTSC